MKKVKIKIYFTPRPMEPEFYNVLVYMYRFNKMMDRTDFSDQFKKNKNVTNLILAII